MVTIKNPMPFRIENHGVRVEHAEKTRSFAKSRRAKIPQRRLIFRKCAGTLYRKFSEHKKNKITKILNFAPSNAMKTWKNEVANLYPEQPSI